MANIYQAIRQLRQLLCDLLYLGLIGQPKMILKVVVSKGVQVHGVIF